jgi:peptidoglycan-N-acetylglucosamine deacetylase
MWTIYRNFFVLLFALSIIANLYCLIRRYKHSILDRILGRPIKHVNTNDKVIALTFDDGPNPPYTEQILELLYQNNAKATFFVKGRKVKEYPSVFKKIFLYGNEVGNHTWDHQRLVNKSRGYIEEQIALTDKIIRDMGYQGNISFRSPFGFQSYAMQAVLKNLNKLNILWNISFTDWDSPNWDTAHLIKISKIFEITSGSIVLLHDGGGPDRTNTVELVELILKKYQSQGYKFVTISELLSYQNQTKGFNYTEIQKGEH